MATATATQQKTKHQAFPRKLGRFINLEGGLYGTLDMVAITADLLELQTGEDFIRLDREQATNLRDTLDKFLAFDKHAAAAEGAGEELEAAAVLVEEQETITRAHRPRRRRKSS
jgi:hypothetical protein